MPALPLGWTLGGRAVAVALPSGRGGYVPSPPTRSRGRQGRRRGVDARLDEALARSAVFGVLPVEGRTLLAELAWPRRFAAGEALMRQGDPSGEMYVLLAG